MTQICVDNLTIIGPDNGLSPGRRQAIIWTNAGLLLISIEIHTFSFKEMHLKMSSGKWRPFCLGLNVLISIYLLTNLCRIPARPAGGCNLKWWRMFHQEYQCLWPTPETFWLPWNWWRIPHNHDLLIHTELLWWVSFHQEGVPSESWFSLGL